MKTREFDIAAVNPETLLYDIEYAFAHLKRFPEVIHRDDGIIQTDNGCYRLAYEKGKNGKNYVALFYGRHPDDIAKDPNAADEESDILNKDRVLLVEMREIRHSQLHDDEQLDLRWVPVAIHANDHDLSRSNVNEACLHSISNEDVATRISRFFTYTANGPVNRRQIRMTSRIGADGGLIEPENGFDGAGKELTDPSCTIAVRIEPDRDDFDGDVRPVTINRFNDKLVPGVELRDLSRRVNRLWLGRDPVQFDEDPVVVVFRLAEKVTDSLKNVADLWANNKEELFRRALPIAVSFVMGGFLRGTFETARDFFADRAADGASELGEHQWSRRVPEERHNLVKHHFSRSNHVHSGIHDSVMRCDIDQFGGLKWMTDPRRFSFANEMNLVKRSDESDFKYWLLSYLKNPRKTIFNYFGTGKNIHEILHAPDLTVFGRATNGVCLSYVKETATFYAWYNPPFVLPSTRRLVSGADHFFQENKVISFDARKFEDGFRTISFDQLKSELPIVVPQSFKNELPQPYKPEPEIMAPQPPTVSRVISDEHLIETLGV